MNNLNISFPLSYKTIIEADKHFKLNVDDNRSIMAKKIVTRVLSSTLLTIAAAVETIFFTTLAFGASHLYFFKPKQINVLIDQRKLSAKGCKIAFKNIFKNSYVEKPKLSKYEKIKSKISAMAKMLFKNIKQNPLLTVFLVALVGRLAFKYNIVKFTNYESQSKIDPEKLAECIISKKSRPHDNLFHFPLSVFRCDNTFETAYQKDFAIHGNRINDKLNLAPKFCRLIQSSYRSISLLLHPDKTSLNTIPESVFQTATDKLSAANNQIQNYCDCKAIAALKSLGF